MSSTITHKAHHPSSKGVYHPTVVTENVEGYEIGGYHPTVIGDVFLDGRYEVAHKLGWGTYSTVWLASDRVSDRYVALKIVVAAGPKKAPKQISSVSCAARTRSTLGSVLFGVSSTSSPSTGQTADTDASFKKWKPATYGCPRWNGLRTTRFPSSQRGPLPPRSSWASPTCTLAEYVMVTSASITSSSTTSRSPTSPPGNPQPLPPRERRNLHPPPRRRASGPSRASLRAHANPHPNTLQQAPRPGHHNLRFR
ncbi:hypothetical protein VTI74DRAFT_10727 [Chaetomium olivicolor]